MTARHDDHAVTETLELLRVARAHHDGNPAARDLAQDAIDLGSRSHVDALGRLVRDEDRWLGQHRTRHDDLLLVAARERGYWCLERGRLHGERRQFALDARKLAAAVHERTGWKAVDSGDRRVLAHVQSEHQ